MFFEPDLTKAQKVLHTKGNNTWQDPDIWRTIINHFTGIILFLLKGSWLKDNQGSCPKPQHQSLAELQLEVSGCQRYFQSPKLAASPQPQSWYLCAHRGRVTCCPLPACRSSHTTNIREGWKEGVSSQGGGLRDEHQQRCSHHPIVLLQWAPTLKGQLQPQELPWHPPCACAPPEAQRTWVRKITLGRSLSQWLWPGFVPCPGSPRGVEDRQQAPQLHLIFVLWALEGELQFTSQAEAEMALSISSL